jgi:hypothetical protein
MKNLVNRSRMLILFGMLAPMVWCFAAHANTSGGDTWRFQIAPYAWLAGQKGTVATLPGLPPADWDANINLGYQWTQGFSSTIGYRYLDVDYADDGFLYDVAQDGLVLGLSWRF